jgi:hypothetical protein
MLLGNYNVFNKNPGRCIGGLTDPTYFLKNSTAYNFYTGDHVVSGETDKSSFSGGYLPPYTWTIAPKAGGLSSHRATNITFDDLAALAGGLPGSGSSTITFSQTGTGGLIVSGSGSATITFSSTAVILSVASASGSVTITFSSTAEIGAEAGLTGTTSITLSGTAQSYAIGYMAGLSTSENEFSPAALASAVWDALTADYNTAGTMGAAMSAAGGAGDPWITNLPGTYVAGQAGYILGNQVLTEDDLNAIADIVLRRATSNIEASSDGDALSLRSLYGMIAQGVHKTSISSNTLTVTKSDEVTTLGTRTIVTSNTAKPIVSFDTD